MRAIYEILKGCPDDVPAPETSDPAFITETELRADLRQDLGEANRAIQNGIIFGAVLLVLAVGFADHAAALFAIIPVGAVGALLILAGSDLAISRRLFDGKPSCLWVIGFTTLVTLTMNPALGLILGWISEFIRAAIVRRFIPERPKP